MEFEDGHTALAGRRVSDATVQEVCLSELPAAPCLSPFPRHLYARACQMAQAATTVAAEHCQGDWEALYAWLCHASHLTLVMFQATTCAGAFLWQEEFPMQASQWQLESMRLCCCRVWSAAFCKVELSSCQSFIDQPGPVLQLPEEWLLCCVPCIISPCKLGLGLGRDVLCTSSDLLQATSEILQALHLEM